MLACGGNGLEASTEMAVLAANYIRASLTGTYHLPFDEPSMHEVVFTDKEQTPHGVKTLDIAKRLLDHGHHAPTIYFPLVVNGALMIEPTETESRETLDYFIDVMKTIAREARDDPSLLHDAPHDTPNTRLDEARAARRPDLRWKPE